MKKIISLVLCIFFLSQTIYAKLCHPDDEKALLQIQKDFGNPYILTSWIKENDCCTQWYCVECDPTTHRINSLTIFAGVLSGQIPPSVGDLPYLKTLDFHKLSNVTGPIQPAISKLRNLQFLRLNWLNLTGQIPSFLGTLKSLTFLDLSFNDLSGSIPPELGSLPNLIALHLDRNKLTGDIPSALGGFPGNSSPDIYLSHNQLTGGIPSTFKNLRGNSVIDLSRNRLVGDAYMLFGLNKTVQSIDLSRNMLRFDFSKVVFPSGLTYLDINHNNIYGNLPTQLTELRLQFLNVSYNALCGKIPVGGNLQSFDVYNYLHNKCLCGSPLPPCK